MSLICQCVFATKDNKKLPIVKECLASLMATVNLKKHRWIIVNNSCTRETEQYLDNLPTDGLNVTILHLKENIGTARGINKGLYSREPGEVCIKTDDDVAWSISGWVEQLEKYCKGNIGILGLKRDDIWQRPDHENFNYRTKMQGKLEICPDIMGTCTAYNPLMMDKVGGLIQCSEKYGYDDSIYSCRSIAAGFSNAFLPHIKITNLDKGGTEYTEWKKREAGLRLTEAGEYMEMIKNGTIDYFYDGE